MEDIPSLIGQIKSGNLDAYEPIVLRFQDMAVGYGYAMLGDVQLAEDAAQEAFITAYLELPALHDPQAFPGWFRRIVIKHIDRIRRKRRQSIALEHISNVSDSQPELIRRIEQQEVSDAILRAIEVLPMAQREAVTLFYMGTYSHQEISAFLNVPISTVKMRLYHARQALQRQLLSLIEEELPRRRPSRNPAFMEKIMSYQIATKALPAQPIISLVRDSYISDLQAHLDGGIKTLTVYAQARGAQVIGLPFAIYHGAIGEDQHATVEICLPVAGAIQSTIEITAKELPAAQVAYAIATLRQSIYPGVLKAYEAIRAWIGEQGHAAGAHPREIYLNFNTSIFSPTASLDDPCVEIAWPYEESVLPS
jgi:RNA polymerase sigma factor (sigma-70 family)